MVRLGGVVWGVVVGVLLLFVGGGLPANSRLHPTEIAPLRRAGMLGLVLARCSAGEAPCR